MADIFVIEQQIEQLKKLLNSSKRREDTLNLIYLNNPVSRQIVVQTFRQKLNHKVGTLYMKQISSSYSNQIIIVHLLPKTG